MKKGVYVLSGLLLVVTMVFAIGCTKTPAAPATQTITGTISPNAVTPATTPGGNATITITTPTGLEIYPVSPNASTTYAGQVCSVDQLDQYIAAGSTYNCTVVIGPYNNVEGIYVTSPGQSVTGTIAANAVTPATTPGGNATITITTPTGPKIYPVSPNTSTTYAGQVCSLDQLDQYIAANATYNCTVVIGPYNNVEGIYVHNP